MASEVEGRTLAKRGAFTGGHVVNPFTGQQIPVYVADYVLMRYGTGAIMAVPAEDERDWDFAWPTVSLSCAPPVRPKGSRAAHGPVTAVKENSGFLDGLDVAAAKERAIEWLEAERTGPADRQLPPARLAGVAPAFLGMPHPHRLLPRSRSCRCPRGPAARARSRRRRVPAYRRVTAHPAPDLPPHDLSRLRGTGRTRDGHDGHVRRFLVVLPAVLRSVDTRPALRSRRRRALHARRPVHRRHRARHLASALRPLLHAGPHRRGPRPRVYHASRSVVCSPRA